MLGEHDSLGGLLYSTIAAAYSILSGDIASVVAVCLLYRVCIWDTQVYAWDAVAISIVVLALALLIAVITASFYILAPDQQAVDEGVVRKAEDVDDDDANNNYHRGCEVAQAFQNEAKADGFHKQHMFMMEEDSEEGEDGAEDSGAHQQKERQTEKIYSHCHLVVWSMTMIFT
jgi:hypothetical protein